jgi:hypothetical protein
MTYPWLPVVSVWDSSPSVFDDPASDEADERLISALAPSAPLMYTTCPLFSVVPVLFLTYALRTLAFVAEFAVIDVWSTPTVIAVVPDVVIGAVPDTDVTYVPNG